MKKKESKKIYSHDSICWFSFHRNAKWESIDIYIIIKFCCLGADCWGLNGDFISFIIRIIDLRIECSNTYISKKH